MRYTMLEMKRSEKMIENLDNLERQSIINKEIVNAIFGICKNMNSNQQCRDTRKKKKPVGIFRWGSTERFNYIPERIVSHPCITYSILYFFCNISFSNSSSTFQKKSTPNL